MTYTYSKRKGRNYEFIFIFLHLFAVLSTSAPLSSEMYFRPNAEKKCNSLLILMNLIGLLIFVHVLSTTS